MRPSRIGLSMASLMAAAAIGVSLAGGRVRATDPRPRPRTLPKPGTLDREIADYNAEVDRRKAEKKQAKRLADQARQEQPDHFPDAGKMVQPAGEGEK